MTGKTEGAGPESVGQGPMGQVASRHAAERGGLALDLVAGGAAVGSAALVFHRLAGAAGLLPAGVPGGPYAVMGAGVAVVGIAFGAAHRPPLARYPVIRQFLRFGCTGSLNAAIDFGTLNLLVWLAGVYSGIGLVPLNLVAFAAASLNSFAWNKLWTFRRGGRIHMVREFGAFYAVSLSGVAINSAILWAITTLVPRPPGLPPIAWVNGAKLAAGVTSALWSFLWYRGWVFGQGAARRTASRRAQGTPRSVEAGGG